VLEKDEEDQVDRSCKRIKKEILHRVKEERGIAHKLTRREADWIGHILLRSCLIKHVTEGKIEGMGRRGRRRKHLLDDLKVKTEY